MNVPARLFPRDVTGRNDAEAAVSLRRGGAAALSGGVAGFLLWSRRLRADQGACSALGELGEGGSAPRPQARRGEPSSPLLLPCRPGSAGWPPGWFHGALVCYSEQSLLQVPVRSFLLKEESEEKERNG